MSFWKHNIIKMKKMLIIFLISLFCRAIPILAEGEFLIDTSITYILAENNQVRPQAVFDGTNYFIVWRDQRSGKGYEGYDIYGARVNQAGVLLDTAGIAISTAKGDQEWPSVAFDGTNYLVVWQDKRNGRNPDIYGARVTKSGEVLDQDGILISTTDVECGHGCPSVAFNGINYFVVWQYGGTSIHDKGIYGARVTKSGVVLDISGIRISTSPQGSYDSRPSLAFDGTNYLVVYRRGGLLYGTRFSPSGSVLDPGGIQISTALKTYIYYSVAFDGTNYLVLRKERYPDRLVGVRITPSGIVDTTEIPVPGVGPVVFNGTNYFLVWRQLGQSDDIYGARITPSGDVLDTAGIPILHTPDSEICCSVAFDGTNYLVVIHRGSCGERDIYAARVNQSGMALDTAWIPISLSANYQHSPAIAFDGTNYLTIWQDARRGTGNYDIYGALINPLGVVITPQGIPISNTPNRYGRIPAVAFDGTNYLTVWDGYHDIYSARVNQSGVVLDTAAILVSGWVQAPLTVAFDGANYLVAWTDRRNGMNCLDIYGGRVNQSGILLDTAGIPISTAYGYQSPSSIAFNGTNYLVVWGDIYGKRINQSGVVLGTTIPISTADGGQNNPSVTSDGTNYFVVWEDSRNSIYHDEYDIYGARVNESGSVLDTTGIAISIAAKDQMYPSVAFDGKNYIVIWQDERNSNWDIYGACLDTSGEIIDSFTVSTQTGNQIEPAIARGAGNQFLITWAGWTPSPYSAMRIWGKLYPSPWVDEYENSKVKMQNAKLDIYPNPFGRKAMISCQLPVKGKVSLKIYDLTGRLVKTLVDTEVKTGKHTIKWDGKDLQGRKVSSGIYFCKMEAGDFKVIKKLVILR